LGRLTGAQSSPAYSRRAIADRGGRRGHRM